MRYRVAIEVASLDWLYDTLYEHPDKIRLIDEPTRTLHARRPTRIRTGNGSSRALISIINTLKDGPVDYPIIRARFLSTGLQESGLGSALYRFKKEGLLIALGKGRWQLTEVGRAKVSKLVGKTND